MSNEHKNYLKKIKKRKFLIKFTQIMIIIIFLSIWQVLADLKIINTFDFDKYEYKKMHEPTKNSILIYEILSIGIVALVSRLKYVSIKDQHRKLYNILMILNKFL